MFIDRHSYMCLALSYEVEFNIKTLFSRKTLKYFKKYIEQMYVSSFQCHIYIYNIYHNYQKYKKIFMSALSPVCMKITLEFLKQKCT